MSPHSVPESGQFELYDPTKATAQKVKSPRLSTPNEMHLSNDDSGYGTPTFVSTPLRCHKKAGHEECATFMEFY